MKKKIFMSAAKKARIALTVMAVCGFTLAGAQSTFAEDPSTTTEHPVKIDAEKNIICGEGATASNDPDSDWPGSGIIVIGNGTVAKGYESTAIGNGANATGDYTTALGAQAKAARSSVAIGANADASLGEKSVAIGNSSIGTGQWSVAIGSVSEASGDSTLALGYHSVASASKSVALGCDTEAREENSTAIGYYSKAKGKNSMAIGYTSVAQEENTTAIGFKSEAHGKASTVIGSGAIVYGENSVAIGFGSYTDRENSVSVGHGAIEYDGPQYRQIINVADGTENNDAATYGQIIKAGEYTMTLGTDGKGQVTLQTNAGANGPTIKVDASALAGGGSTLTQDDFNNMLNASTKFNDLQAAVGNKANANGDNITTDAGSKWADKLGTGAIAKDDKNLVNGETVYNKIGDTDKLTDAGLGSNLSDAVLKVNTKAEAAQTTANSALDKAKANETKIGDLAKLDTAEKGNLVGAVNEVNKKATANETKIGDLTKLKTTEKGNLVGAVNDVYEKADKNAKDIASLGGRVDTLGGAVSKLDTKVNKVGAGAAALAALHPMDFDPDNKLTFAAGVGNYRGANAAAIGAFYRPNEQVMFSIAGNMGNGENMVNAGVSFALDRPSKTPTTKAALVKTVAAQNEQIAALNETVAEQNEKIARLEAMVEKLAAKQNA